MKISVVIGASLLGLAALPARADDISANGGSDVVTLPLAGGSDQESNGVVLVIGGAAHGFTDSLALPAHDRTLGRSTYFRLVMPYGFAIDGAYDNQTGDGEMDPTETNTVSLGASMNVDQWTFGVGWASGDSREILVDLGGGEENVVSFTTSYSVQPGIRIDGLLEYRDDNAIDSRANDGDFAIGLSTLINF